MKGKVTRGALWNEAAKSGVLLGIVPVAYMFLTQLVGKVAAGHAVIAGCVNFLLWAVKFGGCVWLMMVFMKKFAQDYRADNRDTFKYGTIVALCSAIIVAGFSLFNLLVISPDLITQQFETMIESYSSMLDSNSMAVMDKIEAMFPQITFFSNLVYCFLFGLILSYILSRNIPPRNAFVAMMDEMRRNGTLEELERRADDQDADVQDSDEKNDKNDEDNTLKESDFR
ncbi:MAG: DUF4199 domain-containing protein [Bacteroidales bacterium]|nr:DUF4199 domain-containing protein [Bacteroidales bacterium]